MNRPWRRCSGPACAVLVAAIGVVAGCRAPTSRLELVSYKDPYFPEPYHVTFEACAYRIDPSGDRDITARARVTPEAPDAEPVRQLLYVHVFWQPKPGRTPDNPTGVDATVRYVIATPKGRAVYSGTAFVYPKEGWGKTLHAQIESANLRLESQTGTVPEVLGDTRLHGTLVARQNPAAAVDAMCELERLAAAP